MNKQISRAIELTQRLRAVMLQAVALEKEVEEWESSEEYMQSLVGEMVELTEAWNRSDDAAAAWDRMSDKQREAYFKKVERLNKKSSKSRLKKRALKPIRASAVNLKEEDATEDHTAILAQIDQLLYALMNAGGEEGWNDEADYEERTQLKLGEALKDRMILARAIKI